MEGWRECTLGDIVALQRGHDLPESIRNEGIIPVIGSFGITGWHDEAKVKNKVTAQNSFITILKILIFLVLTLVAHKHL